MSAFDDRRLLLFTKPAREGRVKTRLIGDLTAAQAAALHAAFLGDLLARLAPGQFALRLAWALEAGEAMPPGPVPGIKQRGADLGERLYAALADAAVQGAPGEGWPGARVMALGSDHPTLPLALVHDAFERLEAGAPIVLGPAEDGGYYLVGLRAEAIDRRLFSGIDWSTERVLAQTLDRCVELGLTPHLLPRAMDVDTPDDLARLAEQLAKGDLGCPRTRALLASWNRLPVPTADPAERPDASNPSDRSAGSEALR